MKYRIAELGVDDLNEAVQKVEVLKKIPLTWPDRLARPYCQDWRYGGVIVERENISITHDDGGWSGWVGNDVVAFGPTALIAAMRAHCIAEFGDEVDLYEAG